MENSGNTNVLSDEALLFCLSYFKNHDVTVGLPYLDIAQKTRTQLVQELTSRGYTIDFVSDERVYTIKNTKTNAVEDTTAEVVVENPSADQQAAVQTDNTNGAETVIPSIDPNQPAVNQ